MEIDYKDLQPSQLYLSEKKVKAVKSWLTSDKLKQYPITVRLFEENDKLVVIDGHTRLFCAVKMGITRIPIILDEEQIETDLNSLYTKCLHWCRDSDIYMIEDLQNRIIATDLYQSLWIDRCHEELLSNT